MVNSPVTRYNICLISHYVNTEEYHGGFKSTDVHPPCDFGDPSEFDDLDPEVSSPSTSLASNRVTSQSKYVVSTRIRCGRSVQGLAFNPNMSEEQYGELETLVSSTLKVD